MVISASLQACGVVFPFAMLTSICRSIVTICSGLYLLIGMTRFSSKWILSHSTWYKCCRSGQPVGFGRYLNATSCGCFCKGGTSRPPHKIADLLFLYQHVRLISRFEVGLSRSTIQPAGPRLILKRRHC